MFPLYQRNSAVQEIQMSVLRDLGKYTGYQRLSSGDLGSDDDVGNAEAPKDQIPQITDYIIVESRSSKAAPIVPFVPRGCRLNSTSSSSGEDDELWMVSVETEDREVTSNKSTSNRRRKLERAELEEELAATKASLARERTKREQLEESLQRLKTRGGRTGSSSSEPGSILDTVTSRDLLHAYVAEMASRIRTELQLHGRDYLIEKMRRAHSDDDSEPVEAWFSVSSSQNGRDGWRKRYIALSATKLLFFETPEDFLQQKPTRVIRLDMLITVRNIITDTEGQISIANSNAQCCIHICYVMEGETRLLPYMKKPMSHEELVRSHLEHKASLKSSKSLYLRARTFREKQQWLKRFRVRLQNCPYSGEADVAGGAMLHYYHNLTGDSSDD